MVAQCNAIKKSKILYLPEEFNAQDYLPLHQKDAGNYLVSKLWERRIFDRRDPDGYQSLMATQLKKVMGWRYLDIIKALQKGEVIERRERYTPGIESKGYRLTERWRDKTHRAHHVEGALAEKLEALANDVEQRLDQPIHRHLLACLRRLRVKEEVAKDAVNEIKAKDEKLGRRASHQLQAMIDQQWRLSSCEQERVHTNLTSLFRELRRSLWVEGEQSLSSLDIANSQPLLLGLLFLDDHLGKGFLSNNQYCLILLCDMILADSRSPGYPDGGPFVGGRYGHPRSSPSPSPASRCRSLR